MAGSASPLRALADSLNGGRSRLDGSGAGNRGGLLGILVRPQVRPAPAVPRLQEQRLFP